MSKRVEKAAAWLRLKEPQPDSAAAIAVRTAERQALFNQHNTPRRRPRRVAK